MKEIAWAWKAAWWTVAAIGQLLPWPFQLVLVASLLALVVEDARTSRKRACFDKDLDAETHVQTCRNETMETKGRRGVVVYASQRGTAEQLAQTLVQQAAENNVVLEAADAKTTDPEELPRCEFVFFVASTYTDGKPPDGTQWFFDWMAEAVDDFRVGKGFFNQTRFAVFGCGNSLYEENYNRVAKLLDRNMENLGGIRMMRLGKGDEDKGTMHADFSKWSAILMQRLQNPQEGIQWDPESPTDSSASLDDSASSEGDASNSDVDIEDLAGRMPRGKREAGVSAAKESQEKPEMVHPVMRQKLTKQGYKIIGTHSGVKLCRWTKAMLRGRGGCYKHTFYGIESHRCMEATPSLACANKCVFCWRHHTNPVGKEWKWQMDDADMIVGQAVSEHVKMIKQMRGVPGVQKVRLEEGMQPKHCALSLVGEPIMYPQISKLVEELHKQRISTFLVTNAQFPDAIKNLSPVTQLYVSIDAATRDTLKAVDRPLFKDFWERFLECLRLLNVKKQRTVYRLTLIAGWNMEDVKNYASLIDIGKPDFIEIKGVTFCGDSGANSLTMKNVPYHKDVCEYSRAICDLRDQEYQLACEHEHSCCVLLARKDRFYRDGRWHTWIDYDKFQDLVASGKEFDSTDYMLPTPSWAVFGAKEAGFDPQETRFRKIRRHRNSEAKL